jgi:EPS-associated MarR family transcriptional regulator
VKPKDSTATPRSGPLPRRKTTFKGDVLRLVSGTGLAQLIAILATPILTRLYAPEAFGGWALLDRLAQGPRRSISAEPPGVWSPERPGPEVGEFPKERLSVQREAGYNDSSLESLYPVCQMADRMNRSLSFANEPGFTVQEELYLQILRLLEGNPKLIQRELAQALNLSVGKAHYCLQALLDKGWVKMQKFHDSTRKRAYLYLLTPAGMVQKTAMTLRFLERKMAEYDRLRAEIEALQREIGASAGGDFDPVTRDAGARA